MSSLLASHLFLLQPPSPGLTLGLSDPPSPPPAAPVPSSSSSSASSLCPGLRLLSPSEGGGVPPLVDPGLPEAYPHGAALRNDLGSNISVLKMLNLRFRCFLAKVHGLERRNRALEAELLRERARSGPGEDARPPAPATRDRAVQTGPDRPQASGLVANPGMGGVARPQASGLGWNPGLGGVARPQASGLVANPGLGGVARPQASGPGWNPGLGGVARPQASGLGWNPGLRGVARPQASGQGWGPGADGVGVQTDTVTPELRALHNVLANVKRERDELRVRWHQEYTLRVQLEERVAILEAEAEEAASEQEELLMKVQRLKADLVLFKGLMSNNVTDLDSKIQEKAMRVDMDICRRIDITAKLCDVAQQRNCEDMIAIFQVPVPGSLRKEQRLAGTPQSELCQSEPEVPGQRSERPELSNSPSINEEIQRMLNQLRDYEFEDECDSLAWEETDETLLLWDELSSRPPSGPGDMVSEQEESLEKVIKDTECLFKTREREYQRTIDQIELELATAKKDMNRHLHEYMEMCSMKRGLDVQMETCRQLMSQSEDRDTPSPVPSLGRTAPPGGTSETSDDAPH